MARGRRSTKNNIQQQSQTTANTSTSQHNKLCECCGSPNSLQHCTTCNLVFHSSCYPSSSSASTNDNNELFSNDWSCAYCIIDGNGIDFSSSSKLSVKEQQIEARKVVSKIEGMKNNAQQKMNNITNNTNDNNTNNNNMEEEDVSEEKNSWTCHKCNHNNPSSRSRCVNCLGWKKKKSKVVGMQDGDNNSNNSNRRGNTNINSSSTRGGVRNSISGGANKKMVRNIAQPNSYKEPSTSCKLRSGDVNFPKEQQQQKQQSAGGNNDGVQSSTENSHCARDDDGAQSSIDREKAVAESEEIDHQKKKGIPSNTAKKQQSPRPDEDNDEGATSNEPVESQSKDDEKNEEVVKEVDVSTAEESADKKLDVESTSNNNTASSATPKQTTNVQSIDNSKKDDTSPTTSKSQHQQPNQPNNEIMQPLLPSNFNATLKAALNSYHNSTTLVKSENNPQSLPVPPPFLSHVEECTLKTALAFVLAKANKKKGRGGEIKKESVGSCNSLVADNNGGIRGVGNSTLNSSLIRGSMGKVSGSRMESIINTNSLDNNTPQRTSGATSLLGGLLPLPSSSSRRITPLPGVDVNPERKLQHARDVLKLAVSAVLPLYRGALEVKEESSSASAQYKEEEDDDDATTLEQSEPQCTTKKNESASRKPCAVYDYEAAVETSNSAESTRQLDGLCDHAITRLSALIRQEELLKSKPRVGRTSSTAINNATNTNENDDNESNANGSPTVVTNKSGEARSISTLSLHSKQQDSDSNIRDAIMKLIYNDLIGDAYHHGSSHLSNHSRRLDTGIERECAERRIEKIMAVCHVLHRMLFLDKTSSLGTECVVVICSILSELYSNQYQGRTSVDDGGVQDDGDSKSNGSSSNSEKQRQRLTSNKNHGNKEKYQVVSSRWGGSSTSSTTSYINDRHERRLQSVDILSQRRYSGAKRSNQIIQESKEEEEKKKIQLPLPRIGDVLAVNLLRLLEGAAAIRLHHRQQCHVSSSSAPLSSSRYHHRTSSRKDDEYILEKVASMAATEIMTEIRSNMEHDLLTPFLVEDSATFYYNEKIRSAGNSSLLLPGGKIMMRLHVFSLLQKLSLYEQQA